MRNHGQIVYLGGDPRKPREGRGAVRRAGKAAGKVNQSPVTAVGTWTLTPLSNLGINVKHTACMGPT